MANRVVINICGEELTFIAEESSSYMQRVGAYVNDKMAEVWTAPKWARTDAAVLTAVNIADELFKAQAAAEQLRGQIKGYLDEASRAQSEASELKPEVFRLQQKLDAWARKDRDEAGAAGPAGSPEALRAAVQNGADAVYTGAGAPSTPGGARKNSH